MPREDGGVPGPCSSFSLTWICRWHSKLWLWFTYSNFCKCSWAHVVISTTQAYFFVMQCYIKAWKSQDCNVDFGLCPLRTEIPPHSHNALMMLCIVDYEIFKPLQFYIEGCYSDFFSQFKDAVFIGWWNSSFLRCSFYTTLLTCLSCNWKMYKETTYHKNKAASLTKKTKKHDFSSVFLICLLKGGLFHVLTVFSSTSGDFQKLSNWFRQAASSVVKWTNIK